MLSENLFDTPLNVQDAREPMPLRGVKAQCRPPPPGTIFLYLFMGYIRQGKRYLFLPTKIEEPLIQISHNPLQCLPLSKWVYLLCS